MAIISGSSLQHRICESNYRHFLFYFRQHFKNGSLQMFLFFHGLLTNHSRVFNSRSAYAPIRSAWSFANLKHAYPRRTPSWVLRHVGYQFSHYFCIHLLPRWCKCRNTDFPIHALDCPPLHAIAGQVLRICTKKLLLKRVYHPKCGTESGFYAWRRRFINGGVE